MNVLRLAIILAAAGMATTVAAQKPGRPPDAVAANTRRADLETLAAALRQRDERDRRQAQEFARRLGIPLRRELPNGGVLELQRIAPDIGPVFYITNNIIAAQTVSTDEVQPGGSAGLGLDGAGMIMSEWDGGAVYADHPEFLGPDLMSRVTQADSASEPNGHSTHVAGTLIGGGLFDPDTRGMAPAALLEAYDWDSDTAEMATAAANGRLLSNNSYGVAAGWIPMGGDPPNNWWWIGGADPSDLEDPNFGYYDTESQLWDQIARDAPYFLIVKAAGNDRFDLGPEPGEEYTIVDQDGVPQGTSTLPRPADCAPFGYDCLPTHAGAKNVLTVGAVDGLAGGYLPLGGPGQVSMTLFSGWGPTDDGRIKPDLVGDGMFLWSAWTPPEYYGFAAGTSQATPNVSGSLLLLQQHYRNLHPGNYMRAATLKALAIHSADEAGDAPGPDYAFGWGLLNTQSAAAVLSNAKGNHTVIEDSLDNGGQDNYPVSVTRPDSIVTATLVWADPPGTPPAPALDPTDLMLVNDLDLRIERGANSWLPWVLNPADPSAPAATGDNIRDNVEQVRFTADTCQYSVAVRHKGTLQDSEAQDYSLIISVEPPPLPGTLLIDEDFSGGVLPAGWSVETVQGVPWAINTPVPDDLRLDNHTGGSGPFAMVDNNYTNQSETSLRTPLLDLSAVDSAILRFRSYFFFDLLESINVEVSTNAGTDWVSVWQTVGELHDPLPVVLDLSDTIAGHNDVMLRFRYDSEAPNQGNLWQIDDIELEVFEAGASPGDLPDPASTPLPADGATAIDLATGLNWSAGAQANSHDVYFGTGSPLGAGESQGNQAGASFDPGPLAPDTSYYWRIDEVNDAGTVRGCTWSFTTAAAPSETIFSDDFE